MAITSEELGPALVVHLHEKYIDALNAPTVKGEIVSLIKPGAKVILDLGEVEFLDSSGMGVILSIVRELAASGGTLKLANVKKPVRTLFELVRFHRILEIFDTLDTAVKSYAT